MFSKYKNHKVLLGILTITIMLIISGCSSSKSSGDNYTSDAVNETEITYTIECSVIEKGSEDVKINNAEVIMKNVNTDKSYTLMTDSNGYFKVDVPEGEYSLIVHADGYKNYDWTLDNDSGLKTIEVKEEGSSPLGDCIKLVKTDEKIYYDYIKNELVPYYGLATMDQFKIRLIEDHGLHGYICGIISVDIDDYDNDNKNEMIILSLEQGNEKQHFCDTKLSLYEIIDMDVSICDSIRLNRCYLEQSDMYYDNFLSLKKFGEKFLFTNNVSFFSGEGLDSVINMLTVDNKRFNSNIITYYQNIDENKLYYNSEIICEVSTYDYDEKMAAFVNESKEYIEGKLSEYGFEFDSIEYSGEKQKEFSIHSSAGKDIAKYVSKLDSSGNYNDWTSCITPNDFTNIRDKITELDKLDGIIYKGICGRNISWGFYDDGTLILNGNGEMTDFKDEFYVPWCSFKKEIKSLIIENGITSIGSNAFRFCENINNAIIPDSIANMGHEAFCSCKSLESITIPNSMTSIESNVFSNCINLKNINITKNIISIGGFAFEDCHSLESINIPDSVESIGPYAFKRTGLTDVILPDKITSIDDGMFLYCDSLRSVTIPDKITSIGAEAFSSCKNLSDIYFKGTEEMWNNISISSYRNTDLTEAIVHFNSDKY